MEKLPADEAPEENASEVTEEMNSDEVLSESAEMTDNADSANEASALGEKKPEQMQSDDTSGIEIVSASTTSSSEIPREEVAVSEMAQLSPVQTEPVDSEMVTSASEISCEGVADLDAEEKTEPSPIQSETVDVQSKSVSATAGVTNEGVESSRAEKKPDSLPIKSEIVPESITLNSGGLCEKAPNAVKDEAAAQTETSPRAKKTIMEKVKKFLSPTKSKKSKENRSKSMSPSEKTKSCAAENSVTSPEEARIASEGEEHGKTENEKTGMFTIKNIKRRIRKFSIKIKSSGSESTSLVTSEAIARTEEPGVSKSKTEVETKNVEQSTLRPQWTANRTSLVEGSSLGGTTMTDVPSTSSSSVFTDFSSRKASAAGEHASEEAVAACIGSSPEEQIPDIKEGENAEIVKNSEEEKQETATADITDQEQFPSEENPKNPESKDERKPDNEN